MLLYDFDILDHSPQGAINLVLYKGPIHIDFARHLLFVYRSDCSMLHEPLFSSHREIPYLTAGQIFVVRIDLFRKHIH